MSLPLLYRKSPVLFQNALISLRGLQIQRTRFNKEFYRFLDHFENNNPTKVDIRQFKTFIEQANHSPFWKKRFEKYKINIDADDLIHEVQKLPILTKEEVRANVDQIVNPSISKKNLNKVQTSGTTGSGLIFYQTQSMENAQWAVWWRFRRRFGIELNEWQGWLGGRSIIDVNDKKGPYWRINYPGKQIMFSAHHLTKETTKAYYGQILDKNLKWLHGYPSQLALLASLMKENDLSPLYMRFVSLGAENLLEHQRALIKEMFGVEPITHYGLAEGVANISQLPNGKFQRDQDFAFCEFVKSAKDSNNFRIIGTNYYNIAFPLIRYDTNDLIKLRKKNEGFEIIEIDGRNEDFITLPNGVKLGRLDHIFKELTFVREAQLYQPDLNTLIVRVIKGNGYDNDKHSQMILNNVIERTGRNLNIKIQYPEKIEKTSSGKLKFVISDVN